MKHLATLILLIIVAGYSATMNTPQVLAQAPLSAGVCDPDGTQSSGAIYRICMPTAPGNPAWNGDLLIFAHGYVSPTKPIGIPEDQLKLSDETSLPEAVNALGYAFATTSYSVNGLAIRQGVADLVDLVDIFVEPPSNAATSLSEAPPTPCAAPIENQIRSSIPRTAPRCESAPST
jgi:hypothetical protein